MWSLAVGSFRLLSFLFGCRRCFSSIYRFIAEFNLGGRFHCSRIAVMINKSKGELWLKGKQEYRFMGKGTF